MLRVTEATGETDRFNKVLALWLDLQWALNFRNDEQTLSRIPTQCCDSQILQIWNKLIAPENRACLGSLLYHLPDGPQIDLVRRAIEASK